MEQEHHAGNNRSLRRKTEDDRGSDNTRLGRTGRAGGKGTKTKAGKAFTRTTILNRDFRSQELPQEGQQHTGKRRRVSRPLSCAGERVD